MKNGLCKIGHFSSCGLYIAKNTKIADADLHCHQSIFENMMIACCLNHIIVVMFLQRQSSVQV